MRLRLLPLSKLLLCFPLDFKAFLHTALPSTEGFIHGEALQSSKMENEVKQKFKTPLEGVLYDVIKNNFWLTYGSPPLI